ncbi:aminodeoxychorismate synthase component I [Sedimentimonas flavescens]|uniref:Aminodeoxychorismate synthase component I n=1 Tax=Sedimentimonas flavescens TaxID=2851012 RepID=A0ABT3A2M1_9RHOB|nr:aminodeoxychorismate synthase component I [Sedimentimonas flavescens]MCV2880244.1 aminodeoxychorismate synthase component I [Sedimentimonas flavescens]
MDIRFDAGPALRGDTAGSPSAALFARPSAIIEARELSQVDAALLALDRALADGHWLAGYASYELGYALEPRLNPLLPDGRALPLLRFGVYDGPQEAPPLPPAAQAISALQPRWTASNYAQAFERLHAYIGAGDVYQANLTFPLDCAVSGDPAALYAALCEGHPVGHGALVLQGGDLPALLSRSPELFFRTQADGAIVTRPMKGTIQRGQTAAEDAANRDWLQNDAKNRAENLMIVDLLRNDLSRIAELGSVRVPALYQIETYATVHQMTSTVEGRLRPEVSLSCVLRALFPCGSITGAPKLRAMEILHELEPFPRDAYCGTIGWAAPDGRAEFNVAIRTLMVQDGHGVLNVGGGVVWDSTAAAEYQEALWKSRFAQISPPARG